MVSELVNEIWCLVSPRPRKDVRRTPCQLGQQHRPCADPTHARAPSLRDFIAKRQGDICGFDHPNPLVGDISRWDAGWWWPGRRFVGRGCWLCCWDSLTVCSGHSLVLVLASHRFRQGSAEKSHQPTKLSRKESEAENPAPLINYAQVG